MKEDKNLGDGENDLQQDPLWNLLSDDAERRPVTPSPWFVARTVGCARSHGQSTVRGLLFRWMMPVPLAALAAFAFVVIQGVGLHGLGKGSYTSTDSDFEDHMELMSSEME